MGGIFDFLPKIDRCCFCNRNLKLACLLIAIWSMFATCQEIRFILWPACELQYEPSSKGLHGPLTIVKWIFFGVNMFLLSSSFAYLLGIFMSFPITADVFIFFGIVSSVVSLVFAVMIVVQMAYTKCVNPSDVINLVFFLLLWCYFILIVRSYRDNIDLKTGCIILAAANGFLHCYGFVYLACSCLIRFFGVSNFLDLYQCEDINSFQKYVQYFILVISLLVSLANVVISIKFLIGILKGKLDTATLLIYIFLISAVVYFVCGNLLMLANILNLECRVQYVSLTEILIFIFVWLYFAIVVRSYQKKMILQT